MKPQDRISYSPITDRRSLMNPEGVRLSVWVIINIEDWNIDEMMPRTVLPPPAGGNPYPDIPNWAWHEYGKRVGFWRILNIIDQLKIPITLAINGSAIDNYRPIALAGLGRNWEFIGHGFSQRNMQKVDDELENIVMTTDALTSFTGRRPRGWLGPGLTETWHTPDILVDQGYEYLCDWVLDDQPVALRTRSGKSIVSIPYTQECNDVAMIAVQHQRGLDYRDRVIDQFNQLYVESESVARVMAIVVHPYLMGAPHRVRYLRESLEYISSHENVRYYTGEQILDWYFRCCMS